MDDLGTGCNTPEEAVQLKERLTAYLARGGFSIRKWSSNSTMFMESVPEKDRELKYSIESEQEPTVRNLGLLWLPLEDAFAFDVEREELNRCTGTITKRTVLSAIAKLFDPLGLLGPVITTTKIFLQDLWRLTCDWDTPLPEVQARKWHTYCTELTTISAIRIPRQINRAEITRVQLHGFSDASLTAYGGCLYLRCIDKQERVSSTLISSKSRVAPLKVQSLPRLELCAALLLVELAQQTLPALKHLMLSDIVYWSDSMVALSWIRGEPIKQNVFVANRVAKVQELSSPTQWKYIPSAQNSADPLSRGLLPQQLLDNQLWWHGPPQLQETADLHTLGEFETLPEEKLPDIKRVSTTLLSALVQQQEQERHHVLKLIAFYG